MKAMPVQPGTQDRGGTGAAESAKPRRHRNRSPQGNSGTTGKEELSEMASSDLMVGLEIGTSKICVVVGEGRPDGTIKILGVGQAPSRGVRKGEIVDFETAMKCVHEAVVDAETKSDVMIRSVYVAVAGSHIQSFNNRGSVMLPEDREEIDEQDIEDVKINAREVSIPAQNAFLHSIIQHYHVDGQDGVLNPVGMLGREAGGGFPHHSRRADADPKHDPLREGVAARGRGRRLQRARLRAGGADAAPEKPRRARDRYRRRDDGLHSLRRRRGEAERRASGSAATTSRTTSRWGCAFR